MTFLKPFSQLRLEQKVGASPALEVKRTERSYEMRAGDALSMENDLKLNEQLPYYAYQFLNGNGGWTTLPPWNVDLGRIANSVYRVTSSTWNFLPNSSFEHWLDGTAVAPSGWTLQGDATAERDGTAFAGSYSAKITFGTANTGELFTTFGAHNQVDYVYTCYVTRISGSGGARLVAQQNDSPWEEYDSATLSTDSGQQLAALSFRPGNTGTLRFAIKSADGTPSVWRVDECMAQESKDIATTWQPRFIDDELSGQNIYGSKKFLGGVIISKNSAPADSDLSAGEAMIWFDKTAGAAALMIKAKNASGTVVTGSVALT